MTPPTFLLSAESESSPITNESEIENDNPASNHVDVAAQPGETLPKTSSSSYPFVSPQAPRAVTARVARAGDTGRKDMVPVTRNGSGGGGVHYAADDEGDAEGRSERGDLHRAREVEDSQAEAEVLGPKPIHTGGSSSACPLLEVRIADFRLF